MRNAKQRIEVKDTAREEVISGDFLEVETLKQALKDVDAVYLNDMGNTDAVKLIIQSMKEMGVNRLIGASIAGVYDKIIGAFGDWNESMIGHLPRNQIQKDSAKLIENSGLDYTLLRLTWLYNQAGNESYDLIPKSEPFSGAQVTREAVARVVATILNADDQSYIGQSLGGREPGSEDLPKPSFY